MVARTRTRPCLSQWRIWYTNNPEPSFQNYTLSTESFTDAVPGPCACSHYKFEPLDWTYRNRLGHPSSVGEYKNWANPIVPNFDFPYLPLDWDKIPSSSQFGILQFLAEIDDTIAMFTRKFWSQLSYGSLNWGVLPFVSDVKALLSTLSRLDASLSEIPYEDSFEVVVPAKNPSARPNVQWWASEQRFRGRLTGVADISFHDGASILLDRLGFHPDLATAWDLVPLSFVVDYLIPIGDFLESFRHGGWVKTAYFSGWFSCKGKYSYTHGFFGSNAYIGQAEGSTEFYIRRPWSGVLVAPGPTVPDMDFPSPRQLFNMLYLLVQHRR